MVNKIKMLMYVFIFSIILNGNSIAHVALDYPVGGETFQSGDVVTIQWHVVVHHGQANWDLFFSSDGGSTWEALILDMPEAQLNYDWTIPNIATGLGQVKVVQDNVVGQDYTDTSGNFTITTTTGIHEFINHKDNFIVFAAYPNPFNPITTIAFDLPKSSEVTLKIFNILGEEVANLVSGRLSAGSYDYEWDASSLAGGVYFYRFQAENFVETKKIVLIR